MNRWLDKFQDGGSKPDLQQHKSVPSNDRLNYQKPITSPFLIDPFTGLPATPERAAMLHNVPLSARPLLNITQGTWKQRPNTQQSFHDPYVKIIEDDPQSEANIGKRMRSDLVTKKLPIALATATGLMALPYAGAALAPVLETPMMGVPGLTGGNIINAGFATHGLKSVLTGDVAKPWKQANQSGKPIDYVNAVAENAMTAMELFPLVAPTYRGAIEAGNYLTTQTPLKNTYKINPWKFKANPEAYYHRTPNLENIINKRTGTLQGFGQSEEGKAYSALANVGEGPERIMSNGLVSRINLRKPANSEVYFSKGTPLDYGRSNNMQQGYPGKYIAEVTKHPMIAKANGKLTRVLQEDGTYLKNVAPNKIGSYAVGDGNISLNKVKFYKEHWLKGYKEIPQLKSLNEISTKQFSPFHFNNKQIDKRLLDFEFNIGRDIPKNDQLINNALGNQSKNIENINLKGDELKQYLSLDDKARDEFIKNYKLIPKQNGLGGKDLINKILAPVDALYPNITMLGDRPLGLSPLSWLPDGVYGKTLKVNSGNIRKFGNSMDDVIDSKSLRPNGWGMGSKQIKSEGNWGAVGQVDHGYNGVYAAEMNQNAVGSDINTYGISKRNGVVNNYGPDKNPAIPLSDPGLQFHRRLPFSTKYVPINKQALIEGRPQLSTFGGRMQALAERHLMNLGTVGTLGVIAGQPQQAMDWFQDHTINPVLNSLSYHIPEVDSLINELNIGKKQLGGSMIEGAITNTGYKNNSKDRFNDYNIIPSNSITMKNVNHPVVGIDNTGHTKYMHPGNDYTFPGQYVTEFPIMKNSNNKNWLEYLND